MSTIGVAMIAGGEDPLGDGLELTAEPGASDRAASGGNDGPPGSSQIRLGSGLIVTMPHGRGLGGPQGLAAGGKIPGRYLGLEDTLLIRATPGEYVLDRNLTAALEDAYVRGGGRRGAPIQIGSLTVLGTTQREVAAALRDIVDGAPPRIAYRSGRG